MTSFLNRVLRHWVARLAFGVLAAAVVPTAAGAQVRTVDPNMPIDADLAPGAPAARPPAAATEPTQSPAVQAGTTYDPNGGGDIPRNADAMPATTTPDGRQVQGYQRDDVIAGAEGVFGKGAKGLAGIIEKILREQGRPIGYIAGREVSGAVVVGLRYGSGTLTHKIEGERKVYWTGPSVGFDVGGNASKVFVLVYNLYDTQELFKRFPQGEGAVYVIGGFTATYLRYKDVVLIPIRLGVGWRLGVNAGYMKFTEKGRILPF